MTSASNKDKRQDDFLQVTALPFKNDVVDYTGSIPDSCLRKESLLQHYTGFSYLLLAKACSKIENGLFLLYTL